MQEEEGLKNDFIKELKTLFINTPDTITKENVNVRLYITTVPSNFAAGSTVLEEATRRRYFKLVPFLLSLGAEITTYALCQSRWYHLNTLEIFLESGADINVLGDVTGVSFRCCKISLDYGGSLASPHTKEKWSDAYDYNLLVLRRISKCRMALLSAVRSCKMGPFKSLKDLVLIVAKDMWSKRGPWGCGPRAHIWELEEEKDLKKINT